MIKAKQIKEIILRSKVFENYFSMTSLSIINSLIGLLLYPYLIRILGKDYYGLYVFALSITNFFIIFIRFGFSFPAMKEIIEKKNDLPQKNQTLSAVFTAKTILSLISILIFVPISIFVPIIQENLLIFTLCFLQIFSDCLFPQWYFQAIQKMKFVTIINVFFRLLTIPFIFIFIKSPEDIWIYALIVTSSVSLGAIAATYILWKSEGVFPKFIPIKKLKKYFKEGLPFFWTSAMVVLKQESTTIIIGIFFKMSDVAIYDLANKIILFLRIITTNINSALFPKVTINPEKSLIKKIIRYETILGYASIGFTVLFGYWFVLLLGGETMMAAYPIAIILSTLILTSLLAGSYINFIFIQKNKYSFVTQNQFVALFAYLIFTAIGILLVKNIIVIAIAYALSGLVEVFYCKYLAKKHVLL